MALYVIIAESPAIATECVRNIFLPRNMWDRNTDGWIQINSVITFTPFASEPDVRGFFVKGWQKNPDITRLLLHLRRKMYDISQERGQDFDKAYELAKHL